MTDFDSIIQSQVKKHTHQCLGKVGLARPPAYNKLTLDIYGTTYTDIVFSLPMDAEFPGLAPSRSQALRRG